MELYYFILTPANISEKKLLLLPLVNAIAFRIIVLIHYCITVIFIGDVYV